MLVAVPVYQLRNLDQATLEKMPMPGDLITSRFTDSERRLGLGLFVSLIPVKRHFEALVLWSQADLEIVGSELGFWI